MAADPDLVPGRARAGRSATVIPGLSALRPRYDVLFCDVWGVVHNGIAAFPKACAALQAFRAAGGCVLLVSNAPRPNAAIVPQLTALGVGPNAYDAIVTSGDVAHAMITQRGKSPLHHIGPDRDLVLFEGHDGALTTLEAADYIVCTGLHDDETETADDYAALLQRAQERGLTLICANPDLVVDRGGCLIPCAGAIGAAYQAIGGDVVWCGKPHPPIYALAQSRAAQIAGDAVPADRILCIGDALRTDIAGGAAHGHATLFIAAGIHAHEIDGGPHDATGIGLFAGRGGADYGAPELFW